MNHRSGFLLLTLLTILACQIVPTPPALRATSPGPVDIKTQPPASPTNTGSPSVKITPQSTAAVIIPGELASISYPSQYPFADVNLPEWSPVMRTNGWSIDLPILLSQVENLNVTDGLTTRQRNMLSQNGFVIVHSQEAQFYDLHQRVSLFYGQPYFLTTDTSFHALKVALDELLPALEREELHRRLIEVTRATFVQLQTYFPYVVDTELESDTRLAAAYLGVGLQLLDPDAEIPAELRDLVDGQVSQVMAGRGMEQSVLLPDFKEDFRYFRPTGHYAGDRQLEALYRGMNWLEWVEFPVSEGTEGVSTINHVPLLITLALRQASTSTGPAVEEWVRISETLDFIAGASQSGGPGEYARVMDLVYGRVITVLSLQDASRWDEFRSQLNDLPFPDTLPSFSAGSQTGARLSKWSFLGVRSQLDRMILNRLAAETLSTGNTPRLLPGGLELMSVLGAPVALDALKISGGEYRADLQTITALQSSFDRRFSGLEVVSARQLWLQAYRQLQAFSDATMEAELLSSRAPFTRNEIWNYKELNSALGSWAEQQIDILDFGPDQAESSSRFEQSSSPIQAYVEPNPLVFYQLARLAHVTAEGLRQRGLTGVFTASPDPNGLSQMLNELLDLGARLQSLGDIAARELSGDPLSAADYALIQAPLGPAENRAMAALLKNPQLRPDPAYRWSSPLGPLPGIAAIDFGGDRLLQVGTGGVDRIYVLVPLDGKILVAQGGLYSFFEFSQFRARQITMESWRQVLIDEPPASPSYTSDLYIMEGVPINVLAFRTGDQYRILPAAEMLQIRQSPAVDARITHVIYPGDIISLLSGPVRANGLNWLNIQIESKPDATANGWIVENQDWFERIWEK